MNHFLSLLPCYLFTFPFARGMFQIFSFFQRIAKTSRNKTYKEGFQPLAEKHLAERVIEAHRKGKRKRKRKVIDPPSFRSRAMALVHMSSTLVSLTCHGTCAHVQPPVPPHAPARIPLLFLQIDCSLQPFRQLWKRAWIRHRLLLCRLQQRVCGSGSARIAHSHAWSPSAPCR